MTMSDRFRIHGSLLHPPDRQLLFPSRQVSCQPLTSDVTGAIPLEF